MCYMHITPFMVYAIIEMKLNELQAYRLDGMHLMACKRCVL